MDAVLGLILDTLDAKKLTDVVNVIITSDHGMTEISNSRVCYVLRLFIYIYIYVYNNYIVCNTSFSQLGNISLWEVRFPVPEKASFDRVALPRLLIDSHRQCNFLRIVTIATFSVV